MFASTIRLFAKAGTTLTAGKGLAGGLLAATALVTGLVIGSNSDLEVLRLATDPVVEQAKPGRAASENHTTLLGSTGSKLAPTQSLRPHPRPTASVEPAAEALGDAMAEVEMVNQHAIRNLPITESLKESISSAIGAVYGPGFTAQVYSGGQHDHETANSLGLRREGTKAHDLSHAADIYVVDSRGERVTGNALTPLAQYWLATGRGGVGLEMKHGGIHLDEHRVRFWDYVDDGGSITEVQIAALVAGKRGIMPKLYSSDSADLDRETKSTTEIRELLDFIQRFESARAVRSQGVQSAYQVVYGGIAIADRPTNPLTKMTVADVLAWQDSIDSRYLSEAAGAYQVLEDTLGGLVEAGLVDPDMLFNEATQDTIAALLMERRGLSKFVAGEISAEDFATNLAREWASLPVVRNQNGASRHVARGQSYYAGDGLNKAHADPDEFLSVVEEIPLRNKGETQQGNR